MTDRTPKPLPASPSDAEADALLAAAQGRVSARRLRLLAVALCRLARPLLADPWSLRAVEVAELFADGLATPADLAAARAGAAAAVHGAAARATLSGYAAAYMAAAAADPDAWRAAKVSADAALALTSPGPPGADDRPDLQIPAGVRAALVHDVLGDPAL